ncbi:hypothetical protein E1B28_001224 [Marasmius oreades]|uniref:GYF domain-containing protein n=1 Tax=Marasmius oreades TaxID=181124 RepID=A0A9P7V2Z8_9AGAR|nr:uncharacterized protein E1B28_001224 [Marasmius oreades]KAG7099368.1 hypothetical protein E1B28_001224 [Marasmius oreades]
MDDHQQPSSSSTTRDPQRKRLSGFFNNLIHKREPPAAIPEEPQALSKAPDTPQPAPAVPPPRLPPPTLQELGLSFSVVTADLHPSHFTTPPSSGAFLSPNYLLLCHAQGLDVLPLTSPPEPQPLPLIRRVSFKSIVVMEQRGVLIAIAGRRDGVRVYALEEIRKAVEWRIDIQIKRERERQRREQAKKVASAFMVESRLSSEKFRKPSSSTPPPGAESSAKVSIPRKASHSSITPTSGTFIQTSAPPVPLIPRTPTIHKLKPTKRSPIVPPSVPAVSHPTGLPPPYPEATDYFTQTTPPQGSQSRTTSSVTIRPRGASISEVLNAPPISRINTNTESARPHDPDSKEQDWVESSDDEAINVVAAGASGSQALDERTSAIHSPNSTQSTATNSHPITATTPTLPQPHRRSLSRRNRPANLDLSLAINTPIAPSEPSPAPTLLTLRQALAHAPSPDHSEDTHDNNDAGFADLDDDDDDEGEISLSQALMESRLPDLPPPGSRRPQQPIYISSSHSLVTAGEDEPTSPRTSEAHSARSETIASSRSTSTSTANRRRRWSLMLNSPLAASSSAPFVDGQATTSSAIVAEPTETSTPHRPNRLSRSHSHRSSTSPTPIRRPASAHADTTHRSNMSASTPPLPVENSGVIPSSSRSRFIPRIITNALHNMRSEDRPSTSQGGMSADNNKKVNSSSLATQPPAAKLEYVKLPGTKGSLMIKAVETAKKSFLAILCGENGEKVELFAGTYRTALGLSRTFILPDSPRSLELQLQGDDLVEVFLVFSQNVFGLEPATVRVREVRIGRAERRAARRRAREARVDTVNAPSGSNDAEPLGEDETNVNVSIGVSVAVGSTVIATGTGPSGPSTPALIASEHPQQQQEDRAGSSENAEESSTPAEGASVTNAVARAEELVALATAQMGPYTTFQQLSFAPRFPLASIADDYVIPPTYPDFMEYKHNHEPENDNEVVTNNDGNVSGRSSADATQVQFSPPGLPVPTPTAPSKWFYRDPKGVVHGPWRASLMQSWYKDSLLPADLPVRKEEDTEFILLKDLRQQSIDPTHPFNPTTPTSPPNKTQVSQSQSQPVNESSTIGPLYQLTDKPLLKPISLLAQPRHFGPPALFYSSRGGHSTTIVDARGRSVLKDRFLWSEDDTPAGDDDSKPTSLLGRMGDVKRLEAVDTKDRSVLIAMRQGGVEAVDLGDALLRPADTSRGALPQFNPAPSTVNRREPFVWRIGTPISASSSPNSSTASSTLSSASKHGKSNYGSLPRTAKSPNGKAEFHVGGDGDQEFHHEVLFLGRKEDEIYICERNTGSFRILRLCPTNSSREVR